MSNTRARTFPYRALLVDQGSKLELIARPLFAAGNGVIPSGPGCDYAAMLDEVRRQVPEVIVIDVGSGASEALAAIEAVMAEKPTPILALYTAGKGKVEVFRTLELGALDLAERPAAPTEVFWRELGKKLTLLARIRVVKHVRGAKKRAARETFEEGRAPFPLVAIATSLGGPKALSVMLRMLPRGFPAPIVICQHISIGFTGGLAQWLSLDTSLRVFEAVDQERMRPGSVYIAPSGAHLLVMPDATLSLSRGPALLGFRPSCDALLTSVAKAFGPRAIGVILTGMGRDGARGLQEIRSRGGRTLAQDEATSVVFGMPGAALSLGAVEEVLPLEQIAPALIRLVEQC